MNKDYLVQKALLVKLDKGELQLADVQPGWHGGDTALAGRGASDK